MHVFVAAEAKTKAVVVIEKSGSNMTVSHNKQRITNRVGHAWNAAALCTAASKYSVKVVAKANDAMVGFSTATFNLEGLVHHPSQEC